MNPFGRQMRFYTTAELLAQPNRVREPNLDLDALYGAYQHWMKCNDHKMIRMLEDLVLLDHYSDRLLLSGGWQNNLEALGVLWMSGISFQGFPVEQQRLLRTKFGPQTEQFVKPTTSDSTATSASSASASASNPTSGLLDID